VNPPLTFSTHAVVVLLAGITELTVNTLPMSSGL